MLIKLNLDRSGVKKIIVVLIFCLVLPCNVALLLGDFTDPVVSRTSGLNVLFNIFGMPTYKHHIFTSVLDNNFSKGLFQLLKNAIRRCVHKYDLLLLFSLKKETKRKEN